MLGFKPVVPAVVVGLCAHGLATVRALAAAGIEVHALECDTLLPGFATRRATVHQVAGIHGRSLIDALRELADTFPADVRPVLFPVNDKMVEMIGTHWAELEDRYQLSWADCRDQIVHLLSKSALEQHCQDRALPYPESHLIDSQPVAEKLAAELSYPRIVKPSKPLGSFKTRLARTADELLVIARQFPDDFPLVVQRWIDGDDSQLYFCGLYLKDGEILARFDGHKLRSIPPTLGQTLIAESVYDEEVFELTCRFFADQELSGPVSLEVKRDPDGQLWIIEPTIGRTDYWVPACIANGVSFPVIEYCDVVGESLPFARQEQHARWYDTERDPFCFLSLALRPGSIANQQRATFPFYNNSDRAPFYRAMRITTRRLWASLGNRLSRVFRLDAAQQ